CFSLKLGYPCCETTTEVAQEDGDGKWGIEDGHWCGIPESNAVEKDDEDCGDYPCCPTCEVFYEDTEKWGVINDSWCKIKASC
ncbi:Non-catalytic module family DOC2, partial [Piromyces sp. E2]